MLNFLRSQRKRTRHCGGFARLIIICFVLGLVFTSIPWNNPRWIISTDTNDNLPPLTPSPADWLIPAAPITISSDGDWDITPWVNGSGTWDDPYLLSNLTIDAASGNGISITNTNFPYCISNCTITNAGASNGGIYLENAANGMIFNNTCYNNYRGIYTWMTQNCTLVNNNCSENLARGIVMLQASNNNTLRGNVCSKNQGSGIDIEDSGNNTVTGNTCYGNIGVGVTGLYISTSWNNTFTNNNCSNNGGSGITLSTVTNSLVFNNTCAGNNYGGMYLGGSSNNTVDHNTCTGNNQIGIDLQAASTSNRLVNNNCCYNVQDGICLRPATSINNTVANNMCANNSRAGIQLYMAQNLTIADNTCTGNNWTGIYLNNAVNNTVRNNLCSRSNQIGIWLSYASNNTLDGNNCSYNPDAGILLNSTNATSILGNTCFKEAMTVILDGASYYNNVSYNWFRKCIAYYIVDENPGYNSLLENFKIYPPTATYNVNATKIIGGEYVSFIDTTTDGAEPLTYQWDFGDGTAISNQPNPVHRFATAGVWVVTLTVTDADGDVSTYQMTIKSGPPPFDWELAKNLTLAGIVICLAGVVIAWWFIKEGRRKNKSKSSKSKSEDLEFD